MHRIAFLCIVLAAQAARSQTVEWIAPIQEGEARGMAVVTDAQRNVYVCGNMNARADLDPGPDTAWSQTDGSNGDNFLVKYTAAGEHVWHITTGGSGGDIPKGLALTPDGGLIMVGRFDGAVDWDNGPDTIWMRSAGSVDGYIARFDTSGAFRWAVPVGGVGHDEVYAVAVDGNGFIYVTGQMSNTVDFDNGPGTAVLVHQGGGWDAYCAKYDPTGALVWVRGIQGAGLQLGRDLACSGGHVYVTGTFNGATAANGVPFTGNGGADAFVCKLDTLGNVVQVCSLGGPEDDLGEAICADAGHLYLTGTIEGTADLDPGPGVLQLTAGSVGGTLYVAKLDTAGNAEWAHAVQGNNHFDGVSDVAVDDEGYVSLTGAYSDAQDFDPGPGEAYLPMTVANDLFVVRYRPDGSFSWVRGVATGGVFDTANALATDSEGSVIMTGTYGEWADIDSTAVNGTLTSPFGMMGFTVKYGSHDLPTAVPAPERPKAAPCVAVFPNPADGSLRLSGEGVAAARSMDLLDAHGALVRHWAGRPSPYIDVAGLPTGRYVLRLDGGCAVPLMVVR